MAADRDWALGFLEQARADLAAARVLGSHHALTTEQASVFAMLLQMAFEKFAKAALLRSGAITYAAARSSHKAASTMIAAMRRQKALIAPIKLANPNGTLAAHVIDFAGKVDRSFDTIFP